MNICVFCGSGMGNNSIYRQKAHEFGVFLAENGHRLVYGGGHNGLMGVIANAILANGGQATGVIPQALVDRERAHQGLTSLHIVHSMHERKALMAELSDAFIALPGGFGTFDEFFEILTWNQLSFISKPAAIYNINGYFDNLLDQVKLSVAEGFISREFFNRIIINKDPDLLLNQVKQDSEN